ncbi:MAG: hypothetical protein LBR15_05875 [Methanobrevibacter sp.]|nr:hypothetical protein [Candidatus Methanovirga australis]
MNRTKTAICICALFALTMIVFNYTLEIRENYYGQISDGHHQWLTGSTIITSKIWYNENPWNVGFAFFNNPPSIELIYMMKFI